jgi:hypothetical protein
MNTVTFSRLNILKNCTAMRTLPWVEATGEAAGRGTRIHEGIVKRMAGEPTMLEHGEEQCVSSAVAWLQEQGYDNIQHEVAYSLSPDGTVRRLLNTEHRDYGPLLEGEVPGTLDIVASKGGAYTVIDWKTGNEVEEPAVNWQLLAGASAVARIFSLSEVEVVVAYVRSDHVYAARDTVSQLTLDNFRLRLRERMSMSGLPAPGQHCRYCPAAAACPAQTSTLALLAAGPKWTTEYLGELNDSLMVEGLAGLKAAIETVESALKARARESGGIHLSDGKVWREKTRVMPRFNRAKAEEMLGPERAAECLEKREELYFAKVKA